MAIVETMSRGQFARRMQEGGNFSYEAAEILFDYLEELSDSTGEDIEFDLVAFRCEYTESDFEEVIEEYDLEQEVLDELGVDSLDELGEDEADDLLMDARETVAREYLENRTSVAGATSHSVVYAAF